MIITVKCPHCGENLDITISNPDSQKTPPKDKTLLIQQLMEIREHIKDIPSIADEMDKNILAVEETKHNPLRFTFNVFAVIGLIFLCFISMFFDTFIFFILVLLFVTTINIIGNNANKKKREKAEIKVRECEDKIKKIMDTSPYKFVDTQISSRMEAIDAIISILENNRADDFQSAQNLYIQERLIKDNIQASRDAEVAAEAAYGNDQIKEYKRTKML